MRSRRWGDGSTRSPWTKTALPAIAAMALLAMPALVRAQASGEPEADLAEDPRERFGFFVEAAPQVVVQRGKGSVGTNFGVSSDKANYLTNMTFRLGGGIKGPAIGAGWGKPRPVAWGAALIPINESSTIGTKFIETSLPGQERLEFSKYSIEYQTSAVAGLGIEFTVPVPVFDAVITVTPAIESLHLISRYVGEVNLQINQTGNNTVHDLRGKKDLTQHFIGPGLRLGAPTIVVQGVAIDFFLDASVLFDVAGTRRQLTLTGQNGDSGTMSFEAGTGVVQLGSGFQLRFP